MKTLNLDLFTNSSDLTEDEFRELVKSNNYEVYDQEGILAFLRKMNALLEKSVKEDLSKEERNQLQKAQGDFKSLQRKSILTKAGTKYDRYVKYPTDNLEKKYATYTFAEIDVKMKELRDAIKDKETRSKKRWGTPESKQLDKEILQLEDELNRWKRYGHNFEKKEGEKVEKGNGEVEKAYGTLGIEKGKKAVVGEIRTWADGKERMKRGDGSWEEVKADPDEMTSAAEKKKEVEEKKEGGNISENNLPKKGETIDFRGENMEVRSIDDKQITLAKKGEDKASLSLSIDKFKKER